MKIPSPHRNLQHAIAFARRCVGRVGTTSNGVLVTPRTHEDARRLVAWAQAHLHVRTNRR